MDNIQTNKMSIKSQYLAHLLDDLSKYGAWIAYVCVGLVGKFGWDIVSKKKLSAWYILGTGFIAVFVGFIASRWFMANNPDAGPYFVPVLTLASRDVMVFLNLIDYKKLLSTVLRIDTKDKK